MSWNHNSSASMGLRLGLVAGAAMLTTPVATAQESSPQQSALPGVAPAWSLALAALLLVALIAALYRNRNLVRGFHERVRAAATLSERALLEERLARIAHRLLEAGLDRGVDDALAEIADGLSGDRCHLALLDPDHGTFEIRFEWCSQGTGPPQAPDRDASVELYPVLLSPLLGGEVVALTDLGALPEEASNERRFLQLRAVRAMLMAPLRHGDEVAGWVAVETVGETRAWSAANQRFLERGAQLLAVAAARQAGEDGLRRLARAVEQSPVSVVITGPDGVIEYVNPKFTEVSGFAAVEAMGQSLRILESDQTPPGVYREMWQTLSAGLEWRGELVNRTRSGEQLWEAVSISAIKSPEGDVSHFIGVMEDISDRKRAEAALELARAEADRASRAKSEFLTNMSHEIRTPVNAIVGMSHLALQTELTPKQRSYLAKIRSSSQALLGIINSILDYSEIETGQMALEELPFRLDDVLDSVTALLAEKARDRGLDLRVTCADDVARHLVGDPLRLEQILYNLGDNGIKFTERGEVRISVEVVRRVGSRTMLQFRVEDTGIGISPEQMERLFQPFTQVDGSTTRKFGGTGLGLAVAKHLVELMGGEVRVASTQGAGSEFAFTVELGLRSRSAAEPLRAPPELRGMRVLVVDDSHADQLVLSQALESLGFEAVTVDSGRVALRELEKADQLGGGRAFKIVLVDWKMPAMDGLETARRIKHHPLLTCKPAVILITGHGREDVIRQADTSLFDGFLLKPVSPSLLFDSIVNAMGQDSPSERRTIEPVSATHSVRILDDAHVLLVEDNHINQEVAQELLADLGARVSAVDNGREAVEIVQRERFDLVLMDIQMPVMDGYQATAEIRRLTGLVDLPIIAMTAHAMSGDREKCLAAGMDDYVAKPIDGERLHEVLSRWLKTSLGPAEAPARQPAAAPGVPDLPLVLPGVDVEVGLTRVGGNRRLYRKLLVDFLQDYRGVIDTLKTALELGHSESVTRLVHTLKGVAGTLGASSVQSAARDLELAVARGEREQFQRLVDNLEQGLSPLLAALVDFEREPSGVFRSVAPTSSDGIDMEWVAGLVAELEGLLVEGDAEAADKIGPLADAVAGAEVSDAMETLGQQVESFDFDDALASLAEIARALGLRSGDERP